MAETRTLEEFRMKFRLDDLTLCRSEFWTWSLRPGQVTLGAGILSLNRHAAALSEAAADEMRDLEKMVKAIEGALGKSFAPDIMNYLMLMMVDRHVHYHVIPRYNGPRSFAGLDWTDPGWPALPAMAADQCPGEEVLLAVKAELAARL